ncbi:unnamed protein product [Amoebophrya sp. A25]|nr:unnamed protein product [Amoebophrya sp. A25]|eukprot:GSA25T00011031001.1
MSYALVCLIGYYVWYLVLQCRYGLAQHLFRNRVNNGPTQNAAGDNNAASAEQGQTVNAASGNAWNTLSTPLLDARPDLERGASSSSAMPHAPQPSQQGHFATPSYASEGFFIQHSPRDAVSSSAMSPRSSAATSPRGEPYSSASASLDVGASIGSGVSITSAPDCLFSGHAGRASSKRASQTSLGGPIGGIECKKSPRPVQNSRVQLETPFVLRNWSRTSHPVSSRSPSSEEAGPHFRLNVEELSQPEKGDCPLNLQLRSRTS